jgi:hypothetical protein
MTLCVRNTASTHLTEVMSFILGRYTRAMWDSPYYSESELCGGAVTVSFSKYLPWQAMNFLQRSTYFSKNGAAIVLKGPFLGWRSKVTGASALRDWKVAMNALTEIGGTPLEHPPYSSDLAPCDFWAFQTMKKELRSQNHLFIYPPEACG